MTLSWPLKDIGTNKIFISQRFGVNPALYAQFNINGHDGLDIAAPAGTPIYSPANGFIVEQTEKETGYGLRITMRVDDGNKHYLLVFGHLQRLQNPTHVDYNWFSQNLPVKTGDVIGYVNSSGFSTGNHLHLGVFEQLENGTRLNLNNGFKGALDPMLFLGPQEQHTMQLINDNGTIYLVAGINQKVKTGIANLEVLSSLFGDEPVVNGNVGMIPETQTLSPGFLIHKK